MPELIPDYDFVVQQLKETLKTDPVLPFQQLEFRRDLTSSREQLKLSVQRWLDLCSEAGIACAGRNTTYTKGSRNAEYHFFVCASKKTANLVHWNMRQLSGMSGLRFALGIRPDHWELRALVRTNIPEVAIPDAIIHLTPRKLLPKYPRRSWVNAGMPFFNDIAVEWDSGSAVRADLVTKICNYAQVAQYQLWVAATIKRAETLLEVCYEVLPDANKKIGVIALDWRTGQCLGHCLPARGTPFLDLLESTMQEVQIPWSKH